MTHEVTNTVVGSFKDTEGESSDALAITGDPGLYDDDMIHLLLFGYPVTSIVAHPGTVYVGGAKMVDVPAGVVQFSGGQSVSLPRKIYGGDPQPKVLNAFDLQGNPIADFGISVEGSIIKTSVPCYAAIQYQSYKTSAIMLRYQPLVENHQTLGVRVTYGSIAVYRKPSSVLVYQVDPTEVLNTAGDDMIEVYRIVSEAVTNTEGEFEKPPNYPADGKYPDSIVEIDPTISILTKRVHEIGYVNINGRGSVVSYLVKAAAPYASDPLYKIPTTCEVSTLAESKYPRELILKALNFIKSRGLGCKGV